MISLLSHESEAKLRMSVENKYIIQIRAEMITNFRVRTV